MKTKKSTSTSVEFDLFENFSSANFAQSKTLKSAQTTFNFDISNGKLETGVGFCDLVMPTSTDDLENQTQIEVYGTKVFALWPLRWFDTNLNVYKYYVVYFNDTNDLAFANLFDPRPIKLRMRTQFTKTPVGNSAQYEGNDALAFSADNKKGIHLLSGTVSKFFDAAPSVVSVCPFKDALFAITGGEKERLIYSQDLEITSWTEEKLKEIKLIDDIGRLNKVITLNDYVYVMRDYGINKISLYSTREGYDVGKPYQSDSFIFPTTIASSGDKIYFVDGVGLCAFNGSSVSRVDVGCQEMLQKTDKTNACAICFEGKYYLACKYDFADGMQIGCEEEEGFKNNCLFVFDLANKKTNLVRGVDISGLCALNNPFKSKVVACFNGKNIGRIGEFSADGKIFGSVLPKVWQSVTSDFGSPEKLKVLKYVCLKSSASCDLVFKSERGERVYHIEGSQKPQRIRIDFAGKEISVAFASTQEDITISNVKLGVNLV